MTVCHQIEWIKQADELLDWHGDAVAVWVNDIGYRVEWYPLSEPGFTVVHGHRVVGYSSSFETACILAAADIGQTMLPRDYSEYDHA